MTTEILNPPLIITPRLMAGVAIGGAYISVSQLPNADHFGRPRWRYAIDVGGYEHEAFDMWGPKDSREAVATLLAFLGAWAESRAYTLSTGRESDNGDLFRPELGEWADANDDEFTMLRLELEGE